MKYTSVVVICFALLVACSDNDDADTGRLVEDQSISVGDEQRFFHLFLPRDAATARIVLLLHGNSGSNDQILGLAGFVAPHKVWIDIAREENLILVVPDGSVGSSGDKGWNDCRMDTPTNPTTDDVLFIKSVLDEVISTYSASSPRVYAVGTSNGGHMVMRLADESPELFNAVASVVASRPVNSKCTESTEPLPFLIMNGTSDPLVPYDGGQVASDRGEVTSTAELVTYWTTRNQTSLTPVETSIADTNQSDESSVKRFSYSNGSGGATVEHYEVLNGGHTEPSVRERYSNLFKLIVGNQNGDLEMADEVWEFFKSH